MDDARDLIRLALTIERHAEPLTGRITYGDRPGHRDFVGWSGLAAALTVILDEPPRSDTPEVGHDSQS